MSSKKQKSSRYYVEVLRPMFKGWDSTRFWDKKESTHKIKAKESKNVGRVVQFNLPQKIG